MSFRVSMSDKRIAEWTIAHRKQGREGQLFLKSGHSCSPKPT